MFSDCISSILGDPSSPELRNRYRSWITGLFFILVVTIIWTAASYLTRFIYVDLNFQSPFLFTYFSSSFFVLYLPLWQLWVQFGWVVNPLSRHRHASIEPSAKGRHSPRPHAFQKLEAANSDCSANAKDDQEYLVLDQNSDSGEEKDRSAEQSPFYRIVLEEDSKIGAEEDSLSCLGFVLEAVGQLSYYAAENPLLMTAEVDDDENAEHSDGPDSHRDRNRGRNRNSGEEVHGTVERHTSEQVRKQRQNRRRSHQYTHTDMLSIAIILCPLWFLANCFYNYALLYTSVASSTVISNLSGGFTLFFSWLYGVEKITFSKILGLAICFFGVALVAMADTKSEQSNNTADTPSPGRSLFGDVMAVLGAAGYGLYTSVLRAKIADDECASMQLLLGYMGLVNALVLSPVLVLMAAMDLGNVRQLTWTAFGFIFISGFFDDVISDYLWARSILLTSPTVATVGLTLTIPMAIFVDFLTSSSPTTVSSLLGAVCVLAGFFVVTADCSKVKNLGVDQT